MSKGEVNVGKLRENLIAFRRNLRRSLGLPEHGLRLRSRLVEWRRRLSEPQRAVRRRIYDEHGRLLREEIYAEEPPQRERPERIRPQPSLTPRSSQPPIKAPPAPEASGEAPMGVEERKRLIDAITEHIQWRREHGILGSIRRVFEESAKQVELETRRLEAELQSMEERSKREEYEQKLRYKAGKF